MTTGTRTPRTSNRREEIVRSVAPLFNKKGFAGTSIAEVLKATSLEKGGLYNHFSSKEELAVAAFEYNWEQLREYFTHSLEGVTPGRDYLHAYIRTFLAHSRAPAIEGGCVLANTAVESDDGGLPFLSERVQSAIFAWHARLREHAQIAVRRREFAPTVDPDTVADVMLAALEGTIVLSRTIRSSAMVEHVTTALRTWLQTLERHP